MLYNIQSRDDKNRVLDRLVRWSIRARGCCCAAWASGRSGGAVFRSQGVPMVSLDFPIPGMPSVTVDNAAGAAKATRQLAARWGQSASG